LREGRGPVINQAQFILAVADNMKQRLFTTLSNRAQASVLATRQEIYENLVSQMAVLNPRNWVHENPRFGENEVESFCKTFHLNNQEIHVGFSEYKSSGGRSKKCISNKFNKLLVAVDTLSPSNADCERGFSAINKSDNYKQCCQPALYQHCGISQPSMGSRSIRQNMAWKREKSSSLNKWHGSSKAERG